MSFPRRGVIATACVLAAAGCGSREPSDQEQVRSVLASFASATAAKEYGTLCDEIFAPVLLEGIRGIGLPCEVALRNSLGDVKNPQMTVGTVQIEGKTAKAQVRSSAEDQEPSRDTLELVKLKDGWKVSSLGGEPQAAASATPSAETP